MKKRLLPLMLLAGGSLFAAPHVSVGIGIGAPAYYPPAPVVVNSRPPCPGPGYTWVDGYWANGGWTAGYSKHFNDLIASKSVIGFFCPAGGGLRSLDRRYRFRLCLGCGHRYPW